MWQPDLLRQGAQRSEAALPDFVPGAVAEPVRKAHVPKSVGHRVNVASIHARTLSIEPKEVAARSRWIAIASIQTRYLLAVRCWPRFFLISRGILLSIMRDSFRNRKSTLQSA
jgi:hypothetical protein